MPVQNIGGPNLKPKDVEEPVSNVSSWARQREKQQQKPNDLSSRYINAVMGNLSPKSSPASSPKSSSLSSLATVPSLPNSPQFTRDRQFQRPAIPTNEELADAQPPPSSPNISRARRKLYHTREEAARYNIERGRLEQQAERDLYKPEPPKNRIGRSTSFKRSYNKAVPDAVRMSRGTVRGTAGRIKKTKKMKKRRKTKRKPYKKKHRKSKRL